MVTKCTVSGHYTYRQWSLYVPPVVTIFTVSGHYIPPVVTTCTASGHYVPHSGHYVYRQWSLYVRPVVTICTASLTFNNSTFCPHSVFMCFVWIWEQTAFISLYNINWLVCITETEMTFRPSRHSPDNSLFTVTRIHIVFFLIWYSWIRASHYDSVEITNNMQPCIRIYYSKVYWSLIMFRAAHRSSSGAPNSICSLWFI